jgi:hypothetical protein
LNNTVSNVSGIRSAYIAVDVEAFDPTNYRGMGMFNIQVENNTVNPFAANPNQSYNSALTELPYDGIFPCFLFGPAPTKDPLTTVFQNIHYWNNSQSVPVAYPSYYLQYTTQACVTNAP